MEAARGAAAQRAEARRREADEAAAREAERAAHVHSWSGNTEYVERDGQMFERATCTGRQCDAVRETAVRL